jgi:hypothetical protein
MLEVATLVIDEETMLVREGAVLVVEEILALDRVAGGSQLPN